MRHVQSYRKPGRLWPKTKYFIWSIVNQYREGKVKSTPRGGWNSIWNFTLTERWRAMLSPFRNSKPRYKTLLNWMRKYGFLNGLRMPYSVPIEEWASEFAKWSWLNPTGWSHSESEREIRVAITSVIADNSTYKTRSQTTYPWPGWTL